MTTIEDLKKEIRRFELASLKTLSLKYTIFQYEAEYPRVIEDGEYIFEHPEICNKDTLAILKDINFPSEFEKFDIELKGQSIFIEPNL